jgi:hypothetical protein
MRSIKVVLVCLLAAALSAATRTARAQAEPPPAEVQALFDDISDIDKLRVLGPLKLTAEQLDKLIPVVKETQTTYNKKLAEAAAAPLREMAREIKAVKAKVLAGAEIPKDFDEKVKKAQADVVKRQARDSERAITAISDALTSLLTKTQRSTLLALAKPVAPKDSTEDDLVRFYVVGAFLQYGRIVPLLEEMRKAVGAPERKE